MSRMLLGFVAWLGDKRAIKADAAIKVRAAFDGVNWTAHSFSINGCQLLSAKNGETKFYEAGEIDAAIERLNKVLAELRG